MKQFSYQKNNSLCTFDYSSLTLNYVLMSSSHYFLSWNYVCLPFNYCFCHSMIRQWCLSHSSLYYRLLTFNNSISISIDYLRVPEPAKVLLNLTNRFHVAVRLFSNRSQMTSKCGKNKKSGTRGAAECVTDVLTTF